MPGEGDAERTLWVVLVLSSRGSRSSCGFETIFRVRRAGTTLTRMVCAHEVVDRSSVVVIHAYKGTVFFLVVDSAIISRGR